VNTPIKKSYICVGDQYDRLKELKTSLK